MTKKIEIVQVGKSGTKNHYAQAESTYTMCGQGGYRGTLRVGQGKVSCEKCLAIQFKEGVELPVEN